MNKRLLTLFLLGCIVASPVTFAQLVQVQEQKTLNTSSQSLVFGLEQSIEYAKLNSPLSRAARYALLSAKWRFRSFRADLLPSISLTGDAPNYNKSIFSNTLDNGTVTQSFFDLLLAKINVEVAEFNVTVNDSIYNISQGRFQVGSIAENELLQSELEFRNARNSLTTAGINYLRIEEEFKVLLGLDDDEILEIILPSVAPSIGLDVEQAYELARENNSTALQFELNELLADQTYD